MPKQVESDREFIQSVGIKDEQDLCDMCSLLKVACQRRDEESVLAASLATRDAAVITEQKRTIRMWQLATFAASVMMLFFAMASIQKG